MRRSSELQGEETSLAGWGLAIGFRPRPPLPVGILSHEAPSSLLGLGSSCCGSSSVGDKYPNPALHSICDLRFGKMPRPRLPDVTI